MKVNIENFLKDYLLTASWSSCDSGENQEFTEEAKQDALADCLAFIENVTKEFGKEKGLQLLTIPGDDLGYLAAHDFFLTRNGHGAGFWDKEDKYGVEEAAKLTEISKKMGSVDVIHEDEDTQSKLIFM